MAPPLPPSTPNLDPLPFHTGPGFLDSQLVLVWELGECKSPHGQVMVKGSGPMDRDQPAANEGASEEARVGGVLVSEFLICRVGTDIAYLVKLIYRYTAQ